MQTETTVVDVVRMDDVIAGRDEIQSFEQIEDAVLVIKAAQRKIEQMKKLKQHRIASIEREINNQDTKVDALKKAIMKYMSDNKEKTLDFPDLAKVSLRKTKGTWTIDNEESLIDHLKSLNKFEEVGETFVKLNKSKLNKLLNELEANNNTSKSVHRESDKDSVAISYYEALVQPDSIDDLLPPPPPKPAIPAEARIVPSRNFDISGLDGLNF